jgi:hypothetical protein
MKEFTEGTEDDFNSFVRSQADTSVLNVDHRTGTNRRLYISSGPPVKILGYIEGAFEKFYIADEVLER